MGLAMGDSIGVLTVLKYKTSGRTALCESGRFCLRSLNLLPSRYILCECAPPHRGAHVPSYVSGP